MQRGARNKASTKSSRRSRPDHRPAETANLPSLPAAPIADSQAVDLTRFKQNIRSSITDFEECGKHNTYNQGNDATRSGGDSSAMTFLKLDETTKPATHGAQGILFTWESLGNGQADLTTSAPNHCWGYCVIRRARRCSMPRSIAGFK